MSHRWTAWGIIAAGTVALAAGALAVAAWTGRDRPSQVRLPAEFEPIGGVVLASHDFMEGAQQPMLPALLQALDGNVPITLLANNTADQHRLRNALAAAGIDPSQIKMLIAPHESSRIGDHGPFWGERASSPPVLIEAPRHPVEPRGGPEVAKRLAQDQSLKIVRLAVYLSRGNLVTNGQGVGVATTALLDQNADLGWDQATLRRTFAEVFGIKELVILETLHGEPSGQVERFVTFTSADTVVVGRLDAAEDSANAAILDAGAESLSKVELSPGTKLQVVRIPMPRPHAGQWRSYTPVVFVNRTLLVPSYPDVVAKIEAEALAVYRQLLPDHKLVSIDARPLDASGATLRSLMWPVAHRD